MRKETIGDCGDSLDVLTDLAAGVAGEHLVCADLLLRGYRAFIADQNCPYDVAMDVGGRLVRIQVKATRKERPTPQRKQHTPAYLFHIRRCGNGGRRSYDGRDFDLMALVALDIKEVAYIRMAEAKQTVHLNREKFRERSDVRRAL